MYTETNYSFILNILVKKQIIESDRLEIQCHLKLIASLIHA